MTIRADEIRKGNGQIQFSLTALETTDFRPSKQWSRVAQRFLVTSGPPPIFLRGCLFENLGYHLVHQHPQAALENLSGLQDGMRSTENLLRKPRTKRRPRSQLRKQIPLGKCVTSRLSDRVPFV
jgi:hypothetical protein